jgi:hypothetical protein
VPCPDSYNTALQGWLTIGTAAALAGVTVYLFVTESQAGGTAAGAAGTSGPRRTAFVAPTAGGALAGFTARF